MENKKEWLTWIDDQLSDMHKKDYKKTGKNRVFKTEEDDRDIAVYILTNFKKLLKEK